MTTVIYHGTDVPDPDWARYLATDLVLQACHPIVQTGEYAAWFPRARRFVYVNPTAVDRRRRPDVTDEMVFADPRDRRQLSRLRLPAHLDWAIDDALAVGRCTGVDGLFVDDLDRLLDTPSGYHTAIEYLRRISAPEGTSLYLNRAFAALAAVSSVEAVLVEDLDANLRSGASTPWLDDVVLPALRGAHDRGTRIHRLEYVSKSVPPVPGVAALDPLLRSTARLPNSRLDQWSWWCHSRPGRAAV